jgi:hypothetical protein
MDPNRDQRAEQFDDLFERVRAGGQPLNADSELIELVRLASRVERELPEDLPDPAFRHRLKQDLLNDAQPGREPVDIAEQRWERRLAGSSWRVAAAAAALSLFVIAAITMAMGPFGSDGEDDSLAPSDQQTAFDAGDDESTAEEATDTATVTLQGDDGAPDQRQWDAASLPPLDVEHVVFDPAIEPQATAAPDQEYPTIEYLQDMSVPDMPETAPVFYFSAPPNPEMLLTNIQHALGLRGELREGSLGNDHRYRLVNASDQDILIWDPASAFLEFYASRAAFDTNEIAEPESSPVEIAWTFLETIGFDIYSMDYEPTVEELDNGVTRITFHPTSLPRQGLDLSLGVIIVFDRYEQIQEARMIWLSLIDQRDVKLRDPEEAMESGKNGEGFWPPNEMPDGPVHVYEAAMVYLMTRIDNTTFVLQPTMKFFGTIGDASGDHAEYIARYYVKAVNGD